MEEIEPIDREDLPDYYGPYPNVVREHNSRNVVVGVNRETNVHGVHAGDRVVVSSSWLQGHGEVRQVHHGAPIDGGAVLMVDLEGRDGWDRVPALACMLER